MTLLIETPRRNCCSFCNVAGHRIDKCNHPFIEIIDNNILRAVALTSMFPSISSIYIEHILTNCSHIGLRVLRYKFKLSENAKKLVKTKRGLVEYLTLGYKNMGRNIDTHETYIRPIVQSINREVEFIPEQPNLLPSNEVLEFANIVKDILKNKYPNMPDYSCQIFSWHTNKLNQYNVDKNNYLLHKQPHKFNVNIVVSPLTNLDKEFDCPICYQEQIEPICSVKMSCRHSYCTKCMDYYFDNKSNETSARVIVCCGICREEIKELSFKDGEKAEIIAKKYIK